LKFEWWVAPLVQEKKYEGTKKSVIRCGGDIIII